MNKKETNRVQSLIKTSRQVLGDCALENGAIVAANVEKAYYPRTAHNYHYVWPRDASYICVAADFLKLPIQEPFFDWLTERPEDFKKEGILFQRYSPNGRMELRQFQPDQTGTVLWAIHHHFKDSPSQTYKYEALIRRLADGLCNYWRESYFFLNTTDLWEEGHRRTSTKMENNFTYSLAACARGLKLAYQMLNQEEWLKVADQMVARIEMAYDQKEKYFLRNYGKIKDPNVDASLLGLAWPFEIVKANDQRMVNTVKKIEERIVIGGGVHRYEMDYYDGEGSGQEGAGAWPLLNFWLSIYYSVKGEKKKALEYYHWVLERIEPDNLIPEQIFDDFRKGIKPLAWSHAMFIIASQYLGYLPKSTLVNQS
ncbi:MAG TPA: glycoside hydrolase family 15 protein [Candidatus Portnoybacteria bacterium]|nr:glycoside hydrolase family 15 protein [Candidatus Portnoybacteria bacterium]